MPFESPASALLTATVRCKAVTWFSPQKKKKELIANSWNIMECCTYSVAATDLHTAARPPNSLQLISCGSVVFFLLHLSYTVAYLHFMQSCVRSDIVRRLYRRRAIKTLLFFSLIFFLQHFILYTVIQINLFEGFVCFYLFA